MNNEIGKVPLFSFGRAWTIATSTLTQLIRMRTLYFLLAFAVLLTALGNLGISETPAEDLSTTKKLFFGTMDTFAWLFAIVSTALLIPRDLEDRTLYTILSKPVRRIEYLVGKLGGVLMIVGISLTVMFLLCALILSLKEANFKSIEEASMINSGHYTQADIDAQIALITKQGMRPELGIAVLASFMKASVIASVTILLSTFASSSLFTIIISMLVYLIGQFHFMASSIWDKQAEGNVFMEGVVKIIKMLIPDFQLYAFSEGIVLAEPVVYSLVWQMSFVTVAYLAVFLLLSLIVFVDKEF